jgi:hypothetical protein
VVLATAFELDFDDLGDRPTRSAIASIFETTASRIRLQPTKKWLSPTIRFRQLQTVF